MIYSVMTSFIIASTCKPAPSLFSPLLVSSSSPSSVVPNSVHSSLRIWAFLSLLTSPSLLTGGGTLCLWVLILVCGMFIVSALLLGFVVLVLFNGTFIRQLTIVSVCSHILIISYSVSDSLWRCGPFVWPLIVHGCLVACVPWQYTLMIGCTVIVGLRLRRLFWRQHRL